MREGEGVSMRRIGAEGENFFIRFYSFIHSFETQREREREADIGRGRSGFHVGSLMWYSIPGLWGLHPEPKADAQLLSYPGIPEGENLKQTQCRTQNLIRGLTSQT